jgi:DNA gyrase subunit A
VADRDRVAVITEQSHWLVTKSSEINELAGPGRGVTVIKTSGDDRVVAFLCTSERKAAIALETAKGRKLELTAFGHEAVDRGGRGRQMVKKDKVKPPSLPPVFVALPEEEKK